jgi:hypothetical protein
MSEETTETAVTDSAAVAQTTTTDNAAVADAAVISVGENDQSRDENLLGQAVSKGEAGTTAAEDKASDFSIDKIQVPEGTTLDRSFAEKLTAFAEENNLSLENAQKIADMGLDISNRFAESRKDAQKKAIDRANEQWGKELLNDEVLNKNGEYENNIAVANQALRTFGDSELDSLLKTTGLVNYPPLVKAFYKIGTMIAEDRLVTADNSGRGVPGKEMTNKQFYDKSPKLN